MNLSCFNTLSLHTFSLSHIIIIISIALYYNYSKHFNNVIENITNTVSLLLYLMVSKLVSPGCGVWTSLMLFYNLYHATAILLGQVNNIHG